MDVLCGIYNNIQALHIKFHKIMIVCELHVLYSLDYLKYTKNPLLSWTHLPNCTHIFTNWYLEDSETNIKDF